MARQSCQMSALHRKRLRSNHKKITWDWGGINSPRPARVNSMKLAFLNSILAYYRSVNLNLFCKPWADFRDRWFARLPNKPMGNFVSRYFCVAPTSFGHTDETWATFSASCAPFPSRRVDFPRYSSRKPIRWMISLPLRQSRKCSLRSCRRGDRTSRYWETSNRFSAWKNSRRLDYIKAGGRCALILMWSDLDNTSPH